MYSITSRQKSLGLQCLKLYYYRKFKRFREEAYNLIRKVKLAPMELWDLLKHLAQLSSVFPFQATSEQLGKHSALPEQGPLLLQLPSEHIPCSQKDVVIHPTCTHPYHSPVEPDLRHLAFCQGSFNHKTEHQFESRTDSQPAVILIKTSLTSVAI